MKESLCKKRIDAEIALGHRNPDGLTHDEFCEKYKDMVHIAKICWYFGCPPEELRRELKKLMEESEE